MHGRNSLPRAPARSVTSQYSWWTGGESQRLFSATYTPSGEVFGSVLFLPPFGMDSHALCMPALYAANGGLRAVRFDGRNNAGVSPGEIVDYKLGTLLEDARLAAARLVEATGADDFVIVGKSMSAVVALLLAREYPRSRAVLYVPIVDILRGVEQAAGRPGAADAYRRRDPDASPLQTIFGHGIRAQPFYDDLIAIGLGTSEAVLGHARAVRGRADIVLAGNDELARPELSRRLCEELDAARGSLVLEGVGHDFARSPVASKRACAHLVTLAHAHFRVPEAQRHDGEMPASMLVACARADRLGIRHFLDHEPVPG